MITEAVGAGGKDPAIVVRYGIELARQRAERWSSSAQFEVADPKVAKVTSAGRVLPVGNGFTKVTARYGNHAVTVDVTATAMDVNLPTFGNPAYCTGPLTGLL